MSHWAAIGEAGWLARRQGAVRPRASVSKAWSLALAAVLSVAAFGVSAPASAQQATAIVTFPGMPNVQRYADPMGERRNVCFNAAAVHRWCRVHVSPVNSGPCTCGGATGAVFAGTLITDAQLHDLIGENVRQAAVGANGRRFAKAQNYSGY